MPGETLNGTCSGWVFDVDLELSVARIHTLCLKGQLAHLRAAAAKCEVGDEPTVEPSPSDQDNISESDDALNIRDEDHAQLDHPYFEVKHSVRLLAFLAGCF